MQVVRISSEQKDLLIGEKWNDETFFNPTLDADNEWFVSIQEVYGCDKPEFQWLRQCELVIHNPIVVNFPI